MQTIDTQAQQAQTEKPSMWARFVSTLLWLKSFFWVSSEARADARVFREMLADMNGASYTDEISAPGFLYVRVDQKATKEAKEATKEATEYFKKAVAKAIASTAAAAAAAAFADCAATVAAATATADRAATACRNHQKDPDPRLKSPEIRRERERQIKLQDHAAAQKLRNPRRYRATAAARTATAAIHIQRLFRSTAARTAIVAARTATAAIRIQRLFRDAAARIAAARIAAAAARHSRIVDDIIEGRTQPPPIAASSIRVAGKPYYRFGRKSPKIKAPQLTVPTAQTTAG